MAEDCAVVPKRRIRIKYAQPPLDEVSQPIPVETEHCLKVDDRSEDGTDTFIVLEKIDEDDDTEASDPTDEDDVIIDVINNQITEMPIPVPRRTRTLITAEETQADVSDEIATAPQPAPRKQHKLPVTSPDILTQQDSPPKTPPTKSRRKKRKAAEMIASVLGRELKNVPQVSAVMQEKEFGDVYSPWDSPPPPTSLGKVYIQHKHGFSVQDWCDFYNKPATNEVRKIKNAVDMALGLHVIWSRLSVFSHGVVAGIAVCHALAVAAALASTQSSVPDFVQFYHFLSLKIHFAVYVFTSLCIVSCLDRLDVGHLNKDHVRVMVRSHGTLLVTLGYVLAMALTLAVHGHTAAIDVYASDNTLFNSQKLHEWVCQVTVRDCLLLLCWVFMSCSTPRDLLHQTLLSLSQKAARASDKPDIWHSSSGTHSG